MTLVQGHAPNTTNGTYADASYRYSEIVVYPQSGSPGNLVSTGYDVPRRLAFLIAHELGHALGLGDSDCLGDVMNALSDPYSASVTSADCDEADDRNLTYQEMTNGCDPADPRCTFSPIVISFNGDGYRLTDAAGGVLFDLNADGVVDHIAWTRAGSADALLWLDRDGDGLVGNGGELFGTSTRLQTGMLASNGFEALREWDANGDGVIDIKDPIWSRLMLWTDRNHNGISETSEIRPLSESGITAISLDYRWISRRDRFGNRYRWASYIIRIDDRGHLRREQIFDIVFAHQ